jgi:hypothetical protein
MVFAETFLDSAQLRGSVVSRAKELGYTPRSISASSAVITISFTVAGNPSQYTIPKNTTFTAGVSGSAYNFVLDHEVLVLNVNNTFTTTIKVLQGLFTTFTYVTDLTNASQRFSIPSTNADTKSLTVTVDDVQWQYSKDVELSQMDSSTEMFFLKEAFDGFFEVYFGDGVIGKALTQGNVVKLTYLLTSGASANQAGSKGVFTLSSSLSSTSNVSIVTVSTAQGGADQESIESIKYLAPFYYSSQGRAVTEPDYKSLIKTTYANVEDVTVWGGQKNDPPYYGRVFIAIVPQTETTLSPTEKLAIQDDLLTKLNIVGITPVIVDPDYIKVGVDVVILYNSTLFNPRGNINLSGAVSTSITNFFDSQVNKFGQDLLYSQLVDAIDNTSDLIAGSIVNLTMTKTTPVFAGVAATYTFNFNNAIYPGSLASSTLVIDSQNYHILDVPTGPLPYQAGTLSIFKTNTDGTTTFLSVAAGTVDYVNGTITLKNIRIDTILEDPIFKNLSITVSPGPVAQPQDPTKVYVDQNVYTNKQSQVVTMLPNGLTITLLPNGTK